MVDLSRTTTVLLEALRDTADAEVWEGFDRRYRPIVVGFAARMGLAESDAADVAQETMTRFVQEYRAGRYDRSRGRLRTWLIALAKSRIALLQRTRGRERGPGARGDSAMVDLSDQQRLTALWEDERRKWLLRRALDELRDRTRLEPRTIQAFELLVVREVPVSAVAQQLGMTPHDVYLAKSRVAQRLREVLASLEACFDDGAPPAGPHPNGRDHP